MTKSHVRASRLHSEFFKAKSVAANLALCAAQQWTVVERENIAEQSHSLEIIAAVHLEFIGVLSARGKEGVVQNTVYTAYMYHG